MTTPSDRLLLRWIPLAALLAVSMAVGLSVGPNPFGFHGWPKAPEPRSVARVVRATPTGAPVAIARRDAGSESNAERDAAPGPRASEAPRTRGHRSERAARTPRHHGRERSDRSNRSGATPGQTESPAPRARDDGPDSPSQAPGDAPTPGPLPDTAEAKPQVPPVTQPDTPADAGDDLEYEDEGGPGNGHAYGHGRHGHGRWH